MNILQNKINLNKGRANMKIKKSARIFMIIAAGVSLAVTLLKDEKNKAKEEQSE